MKFKYFWSEASWSETWKYVFQKNWKYLYLPWRIKIFRTTLGWLLFSQSLLQIWCWFLVSLFSKICKSTNNTFCTNLSASLIFFISTNEHCLKNGFGKKGKDYFIWFFHVCHAVPSSPKKCHLAIREKGVFALWLYSSLTGLASSLILVYWFSRD